MQCMGLPCKQKDFAFVYAGLNNLPFGQNLFYCARPAKQRKYFIKIYPLILTKT